jgi:beta-lactamase class A
MKQMIAVFILMAILSSCSFGSLRRELRTYIKNQPCTVAVVFKNLQSGEKVSINDKTQMHAASTMKVGVMIEVYRQADQGRFRMSDSIEVYNRFRSIVDQSPFSLPIPDAEGDPVFRSLGKKMTRRDLVYYMITWSSNLATNILIDQVDARAVQKTVRALGAKKMLVRRGVEDSLAFAKGLNNEICGRDLLILLEAIANDKAASAPACADMITIMLDQHFRNAIPARLPAEVRVAHKTGSITAIHHDAALIFLPDGRRYILVVLTKGMTDQKKSSRLISEISRRVYDFMIKKG